MAVDIILEYETSSEAIDVTLRSWQGHLVKGRSNRIAVRVRHQSTAISCDPVGNGACCGYARPHASVTIRAAGQGIAGRIDHRDKEGEKCNPNQQSQYCMPAFHASEGCLIGCEVLLMRPAYAILVGLIECRPSPQLVG